MNETGTTRHSVFHGAFTGRKDQAARTPESLYALLAGAFGVRRDAWFDPCPPSPRRDGLTIPWRSPAYVNPPFDRLMDWFDKAESECERRGVSTVFLMPFRPGARYVHRRVLASKLVSRALVLTHSVRFEPYPRALATPIMLLVIAPLAPPRGGDLLSPREEPGTMVDVPAFLLTLGRTPASMRDDVLPLLRKALPRGVRISVVTSDFAARAASMVSARRTSPTFVMVPARFNSAAFRSLLPFVRAIVLISPDLTFGADNKKSFVGSVGLVLGSGASESESTSTARIVTALKTVSRRVAVRHEGGSLSFVVTRRP